MKDQIGQRGESIFSVRITEFHLNRGPLFRPQFLGDKFPFADYLILLEGAGVTRPFFFVQVKTTRLGYTKAEKRLKVQISKEHIEGLIALPAPTYIVGIDEIDETGYIVSANGESTKHISSLSTLFSINDVNRKLLWDEVQAYWNQLTVPKLISIFPNT